ncbi:MAG: 4'-phosphopantetheinyl transferase superfamily protein [Variovorax sp.]|nr:MAG: 4'-phosphopantetheinyl transferase superfamily protein [Variovorax sp.]
MRTASIPRLSATALVALRNVELVPGASLALVVRRHPDAADVGAMLRLLLGRLTGRPPESIQLEKTAEGKPWLAGCNIAFNLSHARGYSLMALSSAGEIGCDIEDRFSDEDVMGLGAPVLHASELDAMRRLAPWEQRAAFRRYWVRKEAVLKAAGTGFLRDPRLVVTGLDQAHATFLGEQAPDFTIHDRQIEAGCLAAVASMDAACNWRLLTDWA